jgi:HK97 family phage major capsid protein
MSLSLRLRAERKAISEQMRGLITSTSPNAAEQWRKLDEAQEQLRVRIASVEQDGIERDLSNHSNRLRELPNIGDEEPRQLSRTEEIRSTSSYKRDFDSWLRTGELSTQMRELRAIGAATGTDGATLVPQGFEAELIVKLKSFAGLRQACRVLTTATGNPLPWPNEDDTENTGEYL